ncbi:unnamed protein product [Dicrocoelium dendriticum]|nr:unnamed protein product [Dicrocoelium dendriticum]
MFIRGIIDRLDPVRLSRFPSITSGASGSQAAVYMHKAYLEQAVLILNTVSLIVCLVNYFAVPLLQPQVFVRNSNDCDRPDDGRCFTLNATVNWPAYSFEKGFHELKLLLIRTVKEPVANLSLKRTMTREMMKTRSLWMEYQIVWPLDLVCCISVFVLDLIRRIRRAKRLIYDLAPMFCMGLMEVAIVTYVLSFDWAPQAPPTTVHLFDLSFPDQQQTVLLQFQSQPCLNLIGEINFLSSHKNSGGLILKICLSVTRTAYYHSF